jgi:hypothetical protein
MGENRFDFIATNAERTSFFRARFSVHLTITHEINCYTI